MVVEEGVRHAGLASDSLEGDRFAAFDQSDLIAVFVMVDLIHKSTNQQQAPAVTAFQIGRIVRIGQA